MNTKRNLLGVPSKSNSEKRATSLRRSSVQTPARGTSQLSQVVASQPSRGTSQPSQMVASQPSQGTLQFSRVVALQPFRWTSQPSQVVASQPSQVTLQQPSQVVTSEQPSRVVTSQLSQRTSQFSRVTVPQPSRVVASQPSRVVTSQQPSRVVTSQQPSRVVTSQQPSRVVTSHLSQRTSQFSRVTVPQPSQMVALQCSQVTVPQPSQVLKLVFARMTVPQLSRVVTSQPSQGTSQFSRVVALQPFRWTSQPSQVVASQPSQVTSQPSQVTSQPSQGTSQLSRLVVPQPSPVVASQPSQGTSQLSWMVAPQPSHGTPQLSRVSASTVLPPTPPPLTPTPPAQPCCRRLSNLLSRGHRRLQQCCSLMWDHTSGPEKDPFHRSRAKMAAESAGGAEGSRGTTMPLPPIQPPAAEAAGPATTCAQPMKQVAPKYPAPPLRETNLRGAHQAGTSLLSNSRLCTSQQQQLQPQPPQQPRRSSPSRTRGRSVRNPGAAARPEPEASIPTTQYTINLSVEATWLLMRHHLENELGWMNPFGGTGLLPGSHSRAGLDLTRLMKISLVNEHNRYDDEEYNEDPAPGVMNQELVRRCTEWLRGVEKAKREDKLETLPHLDDP